MLKKSKNERIPGFKIPVIFIYGPGHSGSTLLDFLIGGHSEIVSGGEFVGTSGRLQDRCTCGAINVWNCQFWSRVNSELQRKGYEIEGMHYYEESPKFFPEYTYELLFCMLKNGNASMILDSSKRYTRLKAYIRSAPIFDLHITLLTREPLGVLASSLRKGRGLWKVCMHINKTHLDQFVLSFRENVSVVSYERLTVEPNNTISELMSRYGLNFEDKQLAPSKNIFHNLGGNRMRRKPVIQIKQDESWKKCLTTKQKLIGFILTVPGRFIVGSMNLLQNVRGRGGLA